MTKHRAYVYNKVRSLVAVFVSFEVLNDEDKKRGKGKTKQWIRRRDERPYFNNIVKELAIEDTAEYKDMMRMSHADFQRILSFIEQDFTRKQVLGGNKVISPKERFALTIRFLDNVKPFSCLNRSISEVTTRHVISRTGGQASKQIEGRLEVSA